MFYFFNTRRENVLVQRPKAEKKVAKRNETETDRYLIQQKQ